MNLHISKNGTQIGPLPIDEVRRQLGSGELSASDLGWHEGLPEWKPLAGLINIVTTPSSLWTGGNQGPMGAAVLPRTSGMAIGSLVCGIVGLLFGILSFVAVILGHISLSEIKKSRGALTGRGLAIAGLVTGYLGLALIVLFVIFVIVAILSNRV